MQFGAKTYSLPHNNRGHSNSSPTSSTILAEQKRYLPEKPWRFQGFFVFQGPKSTRFFRRYQTRFSHHVGLELATKPILEQFEPRIKNYITDFGGILLRRQQNIENSRQFSRIFSRNPVCCFSCPAPVGLDC